MADFTADEYPIPMGDNYLTMLAFPDGAKLVPLVSIVKIATCLDYGYGIPSHELLYLHTVSLFLEADIVDSLYTAEWDGTRSCVWTGTA